MIGQTKREVLLEWALKLVIQCAWALIAMILGAWIGMIMGLVVAHLPLTGAIMLRGLAALGLDMTEIEFGCVVGLIGAFYWMFTAKATFKDD